MPGGDTSSKSDSAAAGLGDAEVLDYLTRHPDFFARNADRLNRILDDGGYEGQRVVDLRGFMVRRLRGELERVADEQTALVSAARANQSTMSRIHTAVMFILDAPSFEALIETVTTDLAVLLDLDVVALVVESDGRTSPPPMAAGVSLVDAGFVGHCLGSAEVVLTSHIEGDPAIYGPGASLVRSQVLLGLTVSPEAPPCMLALASRDPAMFEDGMPTDLIGFLARVLERSIRRWLDLPQ